MKKTMTFRIGFFSILMAPFVFSVYPQPRDLKTAPRIFDRLGRISIPDSAGVPLYFIPNLGREKEQAPFYAKTPHYTLWLTKQGLVFDASRRIGSDQTQSSDRRDREADALWARETTRLVFPGAAADLKAEAGERSDYRVNYFKGNDPDRWLREVAAAKSVIYRNLFRNIDLKIYGVERGIEYDWIIRPEGVADDIRFEYQDVLETLLDADGHLEVRTRFGSFVHSRPDCYQVIDGCRVGVAAQFQPAGLNAYGFKVGSYDGRYPLVIDPIVLVYSTYLGGSDYEFGHAIAVDKTGCAYVTGHTVSTNFLVKNAEDGTHNGYYDVFVTKLAADGNALDYSTFLGGSDFDIAFGIAVDSKGCAYVTGCTKSKDFPLAKPFDKSIGGGADAFVLKLSAEGSVLVYSTYIGGDQEDSGSDIALDGSKAAFVVGETFSADFPLKNALDSIIVGREAFVTKISADRRPSTIRLFSEEAERITAAQSPWMLRAPPTWREKQSPRIFRRKRP